MSYNYAGSLLADQPKWDYEAIRVCDHIWVLNAGFGSNPIFSLTQAHQLGVCPSLPSI